MARGWRLTLREGSDVERRRFEDLDAALAAARERVETARRKERPDTIKAFRDFTPDQQVLARVELNGPGLFRGAEGGLDVMGDGRVVAYTGAIRKEELAEGSIDDTLRRLREALAGGS